MAALAGRLVVLALLLGAASCGPSLPDDLPALMALMNENDVPISVDSTLKVTRRFGKAGLLTVLAEGRARARARAAFRLRDFPGDDVETVLLDTATGDPNAFTVVQALWSLEVTGTARALPRIAPLVESVDPLVARQALDAVTAITRRTQR